MDEKLTENESTDTEALDKFIMSTEWDEPVGSNLLGLSVLALVGGIFLGSTFGSIGVILLLVVIVFIAMSSDSTTKKRQQQRDDRLVQLRQNKALYEQAIQDFNGAKKSLEWVALGDKYLFLPGHMPIEYGQIREAHYEIREEDTTSDMPDPERLDFVVVLNNGQTIKLKNLPCPETEMKSEMGQVFYHKVSVSLKQRVHSNKSYTVVTTTIARKQIQAYRTRTNDSDSTC